MYTTGQFAVPLYNALRAFVSSRFRRLRGVHVQVSHLLCCHCSIAVLQCAVLAGVVIVFNPETLTAQVPISTSTRATSFTFREVKFPGAIRTKALGLNDQGEVVGAYFDSSCVFHGYLLRQGNFTTVDPPNSTRTEATGINNASIISGYLTDSNNLVHAIYCTAVSSPSDGVASSKTAAGLTFLALLPHWRGI